MKNVRDAGFARKGGGNAGSGPPPPIQTCEFIRNCVGHINLRTGLSNSDDLT